MAASAKSEIHLADLADLLVRSGIELITERIESETTVVDQLECDVRFGQAFYSRRRGQCARRRCNRYPRKPMRPAGKRAIRPPCWQLAPLPGDFLNLLTGAIPLRGPALQAGRK